MKRLLLLLFLSCFIIGCATRGFPPIEGIQNFDKVDDHVYRGAQPNDLGLEYLKKLGIKMIINLRMTGDEWVAEKENALKVGMDYKEVPMHGWQSPNTKDIENVLSMIAGSSLPVFIHCQHGCDRTGTIIACYRIDHDHWSNEKALKEARTYGMHPLEIWMKRFIKNFKKSSQTK